jgi:hypothetical protein
MMAHDCWDCCIRVAFVWRFGSRRNKVTVRWEGGRGGMTDGGVLEDRGNGIVSIVVWIQLQLCKYVR